MEIYYSKSHADNMVVVLREDGEVVLVRNQWPLDLAEVAKPNHFLPGLKPVIARCKKRNQWTGVLMPAPDYTLRHYLPRNPDHAPSKP